MDLAIHEELVTLELFGGQGMAFAAPQLTAKGREWLLAPYAMQGDLGRRRRPVALEPPETLSPRWRMSRRARMHPWSRRAVRCSCY